MESDGGDGGGGGGDGGGRRSSVAHGESGSGRGTGAARERTALRDAGPWQERNFEVRPLKVVTNFEVRPHLFYLAPL